MTKFPTFAALAVFLLLCALFAAVAPTALAAAPPSGAGAPASFPLPAESYADDGGRSGPLGQVLADRIAREPLNLVATLLFLGAIIHTFLAPRFMHLSHRWQREHAEHIHRAGRTAEAKPQRGAKSDVSFKAEVAHFLGEVEAIFGIWVLPLLAAIFYFKDWPTAQGYVAHGVNFTEPMFVVVILSIASTRPVLRIAEAGWRAWRRWAAGRSNPGGWRSSRSGRCSAVSSRSRRR